MYLTALRVFLTRARLGTEHYIKPNPKPGVLLPCYAGTYIHTCKIVDPAAQPIRPTSFYRLSSTTLSPNQSGEARCLRRCRRTPMVLVSIERGEKKKAEEPVHPRARCYAVVLTAAGAAVGLRWSVDMSGLRHRWTASNSSWHSLFTPCDSDVHAMAHMFFGRGGDRGGDGQRWV